MVVRAQQKDRTMKELLLVMVLCVVGEVTGVADTFQYHTAGTDSDWFNGYNRGRAKDPSPTSYFTNHGNVSSALRTNCYTNHFVNTGTLTGNVALGAKVEDASGSAAYTTVTNTGDITATDFRLAKVAGANTAFNMEGGTLAADTLYMNEAGTGHINLTGGTIDVTSLSLNVGDPGVYANYTIDVTDGILIADGDNRTDWDFMVSKGVFTAYGGVGDVIVAYDGGTGRTTMRGHVSAGTLFIIK